MEIRSSNMWIVKQAFCHLHQHLTSLQSVVTVYVFTRKKRMAFIILRYLSLFPGARRNPRICHLWHVCGMIHLTIIVRIGHRVLVVDFGITVMNWDFKQQSNQDNVLFIHKMAYCMDSLHTSYFVTVSWSKYGDLHHRTRLNWYRLKMFIHSR